MTDVRSDTVGEPSTFRTLDELERELAALPPAPRSPGRVSLIVVRAEDGGRRETPAQVTLCTQRGLIGDAWARDDSREPDAQIAVMRTGVATLIANGQPLTLFGDNLFLDLDLSAMNLPAGSRVRVGAALLSITAMPHDGCRKFRARFGADALRFAASKELRSRNLRGIYMRVLESGDVCLGDPVEVLTRASERASD